MAGATRDTALRTQLNGTVCVPGDDDYDEARTLFNSMIDIHPALIAQCAGVADVQAAVRYGRERDMETAVRSGGHSVAGASLVEDGLVIDVRAMKEIDVDPVAGTVRCGAGLTWGEFDQGTQEYGLATTGGRVSTTGVSGLTLGGGSGWLERKHGLACDNLLAVELVTASGDFVRASATEHPDLFWALHGGGGNFGVATAFEFQLHELGPIVLAGLMLWPAERGPEVLAMMRDLVDEGPEDLALAGVYLTGPPEPFVPAHLQATLCVGLAFMWAGDSGDDGTKYADCFRALKPDVDLVGPIPYVEFQRMIDDPPGLRNYWTADYLGELTDDAMAVFSHHSANMPVPGACQSLMVPWGGAVGRALPEDTPMAQRDAQWVSHPFAMWELAEDDEMHIGWARAVSGEMKQFTSGGVYLNFIGDEGDDRIRAAYGANYERIARVKRDYDPDNFFRGNQNIKPAA
jgi:FAD/FMN-containing dehydrogenase